MNSASRIASTIVFANSPLSSSFFSGACSPVLRAARTPVSPVSFVSLTAYPLFNFPFVANMKRKGQHQATRPALIVLPGEGDGFLMGLALDARPAGGPRAFDRIIKRVIEQGECRHRHDIASQKRRAQNSPALFL